MLATILHLLNGEKKRAGNHSVVYLGDETHYFFHNSLVCIVHHSKKEFELHNCGFPKSTSTTRALNNYHKWFTEMGYHMTYRGE